ncbi:PLAC8-domain-containing protein [Pyrenochaeta sp. DS3sAY3a]|nr:PLAC8-domain-containing protein [Pyrenochaeta sp. DS3sAY3a]
MSNLIDPTIINNWKAKFNRSLENGKLSSKTESGRPWSSSLWGCFSPPDLCCITCCVPCVTFGKTYHRMEHNGDMSTYEPVNTSCLLFYLSSCVGASFLLQAIQSSEIREKHNLAGSCVGDLIKSCCCLCCTIVQAEKETKALLGEGKGAGVVDQQYQAQGGMVMPGKN